MLKQYEQHLTERDVCLLHFLWKWKVFTTAGLAVKFFDGSANWAYNRLLKLRKAGYVDNCYLSMKHRHRVWMLNKKGFELIRSELPELQNEGFRSEAIQHDLYAAAIHLGDWLIESPKGVELITEQELRNNFHSNLPKWVPELTRHRPDGLWYLPDQNGNVVFALEVELNLKSKAEYGPVIRFYRDVEEIRRIVWLVKKRSHIDSLTERFKEIAPEKYKCHEFILLEHFVKVGWEAPIIQGLEQGRTLRNLLSLGNESGVVEKSYSNSSYYFSTILDARNCPYKSPRYARIEFPQNSNCMALQPYPNKPLTEQE
ncbi:hypothetical protein EBT16_04880 [bacterium]|nr:hypothetical protein [bacterium]